MRLVLQSMRLMFRYSLLIILSCAILGSWMTAAQEPPAPPDGSSQTPDDAERPPDPDQPTLESIQSAIETLAPEIESAEANATAETAQRIGVSIELLSGRATRMRALSGVLQQQASLLQRQIELAENTADLDQEISNFRNQGLGEAPPYRIEFADTVHDEVLAQERALDALNKEREAATAELANARQRLAEAERDRRAAQESAETNSDPARTSQMGWRVTRARLEERYFRESVLASRLRVELNAAELDLAVKRLDYHREKSEYVFSNTRFTRQELQERLDAIAERRDAIERSLPGLRDTYQANDALRREARQALESATGDARIAEATATLAMRTAWVESASRAVELAENKLLLMDSESQLWERRFSVWQDTADESLAEWIADTERLQGDIERDQQILQARLLDLRATILDAERRLAEWAGNDADRSVVENRLRALQSRDSTLNDFLAYLLQLERLAARLQQDIERETQMVTWEERWDRAIAAFQRTWNFELFAFEDDSITVRKIVIAIAILLLGFVLMGRITSAFNRRILSRTPLTENGAAAIEKLAYYVGLIFVLLYALNFVNIPLTLFAFLGGAIAIAVGFGAQHLINNFISGFILMLERPIRIGDLVEVEGTYGHIRHIGARSTRLHTADNIDLLIPNSKLLENTVTNWTLSDEKLRTSVLVGVAYGSPTEQVTEILLEAAMGSERVLKAPKPTVIFTDFGDNALGFEVLFWIKMRRMLDKRLAESDVRHNIDRLFHQYGIVIAFPQRDVHFDADRPLEVRIREASRD